MNVYFIDKVFKKEFHKKLDEISLPRIGEQVNFGYTPPPTVDRIIHDHNDNIIYVICNEN